MSSNSNPTPEIKITKSTKGESIDRRKLIENDLLFKVFKELHSLKGQPRIQIFIAHGFLELLISTIIKGKAKNGKKITSDNRSFPYSSQLVILHEIGLLTDEEFNLYNFFRKLRNKAAHEPLFQLTKEEINQLNPKNKTFSKICVDLMLRLWNRHTDLLLPVFVPTLHRLKND